MCSEYLNLEYFLNSEVIFVLTLIFFKIIFIFFKYIFVIFNTGWIQLELIWCRNVIEGD